LFGRHTEGKFARDGLTVDDGIRAEFHAVFLTFYVKEGNDVDAVPRIEQLRGESVPALSLWCQLIPKLGWADFQIGAENPESLAIPTDQDVTPKV
jgi:hypothetical protein